eukprot:GFUD01125499.1.p1 GENE.GFUD01125499.1~~GFUD01125499.1.p1  ORF type:complete len:107 (+),score=18.52 GFUD01125499.1:328-648(+)
MTRPLSPSPGDASGRQGRVGSAVTGDEGASYDSAGSQIEGSGANNSGMDLCPAYPAIAGDVLEWELLVQTPPVVHSDGQAQPAHDQDVWRAQALSAQFNPVSETKK